MQRDKRIALDHLKNQGQQLYRGWHVEPQCLGCLEVESDSNLVGCSTGRSPVFAPFRTRPT